MFSYGEWRLGTDAIRFLDNDYYADPRLYPSLLYLFGIMDHEEQPEEIHFNHNDPTLHQDEEGIVIEDELEDVKQMNPDSSDESELEEEMWADETLVT